MRSFPILFLAILSPILFISAEYPPITLENSELRPLQSTINNRPYELWISYPGSYDTNSDKRYPVLYALDGYWDGILLNPIYGNLIYDEVVPEFIIVGIGYSDHDLDYGKERLYDMTPKPEKANRSDIGGGEDFLKIIKEEIIPYVDENLRTDPDYRVLGGSSLAGFFTLFTMFSEPELFDGYIAISPSVSLGNRYIFNFENAYRWKEFRQRNHMDLPAHLFMSVAEKEWPGYVAEILAFNEILKGGEYEDFDYKFRIVDGEKHAGTKSEGYSRGIRFAFQPYLDEQLKQAKAE